MSGGKVKIIRNVLAILLLIVAVNALGGGYYAMAGAENVPVEWLEGSPFRNYFLPGLFLFVAIGCLSLVTAITLFMNKNYATTLALVCGIILIVWITTQVTIIGYVSWLQPAMFGAAVIIVTLSRILRLNLDGSR